MKRPVKVIERNDGTQISMGTGNYEKNKMSVCERLLKRRC